MVVVAAAAVAVAAAAVAAAAVAVAASSVTSIFESKHFYDGQVIIFESFSCANSRPVENYS